MLVLRYARSPLRKRRGEQTGEENKTERRTKRRGERNGEEQPDRRLTGEENEPEKNENDAGAPAEADAPQRNAEPARKASPLRWGSCQRQLTDEGVFMTIFPQGNLIHRKRSPCVTCMGRLWTSHKPPLCKGRWLLRRQKSEGLAFVHIRTTTLHTGGRFFCVPDSIQSSNAFTQ